MIKLSRMCEKDAFEKYCKEARKDIYPVEFKEKRQGGWKPEYKPPKQRLAIMQVGFFDFFLLLG